MAGFSSVRTRMSAVLRHVVSASGRVVLQRSPNVSQANAHLNALMHGYHSKPNEASVGYPLDEPLPEVPAAPRYPCPFIIESDIEKYLVPLYRTGWGISRTLPVNGANAAPPATQLSKRIVFPNPDIADIFMKDVLSIITTQENHHPTWDREHDSPHADIHIHTHKALAPDNCQNVDDQVILTPKRPGITLRDIRYAVLFEVVLRDYFDHGFIEPNFLAIFPQPVDINLVHNFRSPASPFQVPRQS